MITYRMWFIRIAAFIQTVSDILGRFCSRRRGMYLLTNGHWIDATVSVPVNQIDMKYDADKHIIVEHDHDDTCRWSWLSVITHNQEDLSDFFSSLRISSGRSISETTAIMLYAHQNRVLYSLNDLIILLRDGTFVR